MVVSISRGYHCSRRTERPTPSVVKGDDHPQPPTAFDRSGARCGVLSRPYSATTAFRVAEIRAAAEKGDPSGEYLLGRMLIEGVFMERRTEVGMIWLRRAAHKGHADAQYRLGHLMASENVEFMLGENAAKWFRRAAEQGHVQAQSMLGGCYSEIFQVRDIEIANAWCRLAGHQGSKDAQFIIGVRCAQGEGEPKDTIAATYWLKAAALQGHSYAQAYLASLLREAGWGDWAVWWKRFEEHWIAPEHVYPDLRSETEKLVGHWREINDTFFHGCLAEPKLEILELSYAAGECLKMGDNRFQIGIDAGIVGKKRKEGSPSYNRAIDKVVCDIMLHEAIHLYVRQHLRPFLVHTDGHTMEDINLGHGPAFAHGPRR